MCLDNNMDSTSILDFTCTCDNGAQATGGAATCDLDECDAKPCGDGQSCKDPDMGYKSQHDFICTCDNDASLTQTGGSAVCFNDECSTNPV